MKLISMLIFCIILIFNVITAKGNEVKPDEVTLRNQLFADVYYLKESTDRLQISVEVLTNKFVKQMETLQNLQTKLITDNMDSQEEDTFCDRITGMFNSTFRKYNAFENRIVSKLDEIQEDQTTRLEEIMLKQRLGKNCGSQGVSSTAVTLLSNAITEIDEKMEKFEEQYVKLEALGEKLNSHETKFEKFVDSNLKILQEINDKLSRNEDQFVKISQEITNLKDLKSNVGQVMSHHRPKLPMEVILGLTSANVTSLK